MNNLFDMLTVMHKYKKLYERRCQDTMEKYDLRITDIDILYYVAHSGAKNRSKDITDLGMSKANISKSVENLHKKGLVELTEDKEDRRCLHIELTEDARAVIEEVARIRTELGKSLTAGIDREDEEAVARVLRQLKHNVTQELCGIEEK